MYYIKNFISKFNLTDLIKYFFATNFLIYSFHPISTEFINNNVTEFGLRIDLIKSFFGIFISLLFIDFFLKLKHKSNYFAYIFWGSAILFTFQASAKFFPTQLSYTYYIVIIAILFISNICNFEITENIKKQLLKKASLTIYLILSLFLSIGLILIILKHYNFHTQFDMGIFINMFWHLIHEGNSYNSVSDLKHLSEDNFSAIAYFILPIYYIFQSPYTLLIIQVIITFSSVIPLYKLAKYKVNPEIDRSILMFPFFLTISYILNPGFHQPIFLDFHFITLFPFFVLWAIYFFETQQLKYFWVFIILTLAIREECGLYISFFGLYVFLCRSNKKLGLSIFLSGILYYISATEFLLEKTEISKRFGEMISNNFEGSAGIVITLITNFFYVIKGAIMPEKILYFIVLFIPVAFLPFFSKKAVIILIPSACIALLTFHKPQFTIGFQYSITLIPFIYYLSILGFKNYIKNKLFRLKYLYGIMMIGCIFYFHYFLSNGHYYLKPLSKNWNSIIDYYIESPKRKTYQKFTKRIPKHVPVSAQCDMVPHLAHRDSIFQYPHNILLADYVFLDLKYGSFFPHINPRENIAPLIKHLESNKLKVIYSYNSSYLLQKNTKNGNNNAINRIQCHNLPGLHKDTILQGTWSYKTAVLESDNYNSNAFTGGPYYNFKPGKYEIIYNLGIPNNLKSIDKNMPLFKLSIYDRKTDTVIKDKTIFLDHLNSSLNHKNETPDFTFKEFKLAVQIQKEFKELEFNVASLSKHKIIADYIEPKVPNKFKLLKAY